MIRSKLLERINIIEQRKTPTKHQKLFSILHTNVIDFTLEFLFRVTHYILINLMRLINIVIVPYRPPFIISYGQRAYITHQKLIFTSFLNIFKKKNKHQSTRPSITINNKKSHANLLHQRWQTQPTKTIFSK